MFNTITGQFDMIFLLILISVAMSAIAQILLKSGMSSVAVQQALASRDSLGVALVIGSNPLVLSGLFVYFSSAVVWLFVLSRIPLSYAYPFVALGFVFTIVLSRMLLGESITPLKIAGTMLIIAGVLVLSRGIVVSQ